MDWLNRAFGLDDEAEPATPSQGNASRLAWHLVETQILLSFAGGVHVASFLTCLPVHRVRLRAIDCLRAAPRAGRKLRRQYVHKHL
jgi:hypothetical protein